MPAVSVIIPTYNRADLVGAAILSVLNQTFHDFEVIVVDNGSSDNTREIVKGFKDERVRYLRIEVNKGVSPARNLGIATSSGEYVAFLDDDDEWLREKLELQVKLLQNSPPTVGGAYTGLRVIDRSSGLTVNTVTPTKRGSLFADLCIANCIGTASSVLLRKDSVAAVGAFDEDILFGEEYDLWIRISEKFEFECIEKPMVNYSVHMKNSSIHTSNGSSNYQAVISGLEKQIEKHGSWFASNSKAFSERYLSLGVLYCYSGDLKKAREIFYKGIRVHPFDGRHYYNLVLSLFGARRFKRFKEFADGFAKRPVRSIFG